MSAREAPSPPPGIAKRTPLIHVLKPGAALHRFYPRRLDPLYFDRSLSGRFNAPDGSYGVLYAAGTRSGAFAETFLRVPGRTLIPSDLLAAKAYVHLTLTRPISLIQFTGPGLAKVGATAEVCHRSQPYDIPHSWSAALHNHPLTPDGLIYTARHDDQAECLALFERSKDALVEVERELNLEQDWFWALAEVYGVGLAP